MIVRTKKGPHKYQWSQFELNFIKVHHAALTNKELANMLGHRLTLIRSKCYEMGLKKMELEYWTEVQIEFLKNNYRKYGDKELAQMFSEIWEKDKGWSHKHIEKKRRYLNLKRTEQEKLAIKDAHKAAGAYQLGNKRMWNTRGLTPVGDLRVWHHENGRPFVVIRLKTGFTHYAPYLWQQHYGEVPEGHVVFLKDGNPLNVVLENLELITRAELAHRNKISHYPEELQDVIRLAKKLKEKIKSIKNEQLNY